MSAEGFGAPGRGSGRRTELIGAAIALVLIAGLVLAIAGRLSGDDDRLLVIGPNAAVEEVDAGDRVRVTGTVSNFRRAAERDDEGAEDYDEPNALRATSVQVVGDDAALSGPRLTDLRDSPGREGDRVTVVAEVEEVLSATFFTVEDP